MGITSKMKDRVHVTTDSTIHIKKILKPSQNEKVPRRESAPLMGKKYPAAKLSSQNAGRWLIRSIDRYSHNNTKGVIKEQVKVGSIGRGAVAVVAGREYANRSQNALPSIIE